MYKCPYVYSLRKQQEVDVMYKDVGKKILAVMLCICMLVGMGAVSNFSAKADGDAAGADAQADAGVDANAGGNARADTGVKATLNTRPSDKVYNRGKSQTIPKSYLTVTWNGTEVTDESQFDIVYGRTDFGADPNVTAPVEGLAENAGQYYCKVRGVNGAGTNCPFPGITSDEWIPVFNIYAVRLGASAITWEVGAGIESRDSGDITDAEIDALIVGTDNGQTLVRGTDYTYSYEVVGDKGLAVPGNRVIITLTGQGNYEGTKVFDVYVVPTRFKGTPTSKAVIPYADLQDSNVVAELELQVTDAGGQVMDPSTYTVRYYRDAACTREVDPATIREAGTYYYTVSSANTSATDPVSFSVVKPLNGTYPGNEGFHFGLEKDFYPFIAGEYPEPKVTVTEYLGSYERSRVLIEGTDFEVRYAGNDVAGRGAQARVRGIGNYADTTDKVLEFEIGQVNLNSDRVRVEIDSTTCVYGGNIDGTGVGTPILPHTTGALTVKYYSEDGQELADITNQCQFKYINNDRVGEATVTVTPIDPTNQNIVGEKTVNFSIGRRPLSVDAVTATLRTEDGSTEYDGNAHKLVADVLDGTVPLRKDLDFTYSEADVTNAKDEISIVLHGIGNYSGTRTVTFKLDAAQLVGNTAWTFKNGDKYEYTGSVILPEKDLEVVYTNPKKPDEKTTLQLMRDFDVVRVANNIDAGTATAKIVGMGNYQGEITITYTIVPKVIGDDLNHLPTADISAYFTESGPYYYTGEKYEPGVAVRYNRLNVPEMIGRPAGAPDADQADYIVSYKPISEVYDKDGNRAKGEVIIDGRGNYQGTIILKYEVSPLDITNRLEVRVPMSQGDTVGTLLNETSYPYSGSPVEPIDKRSADVSCYFDDGTTHRLGENEFDVAYDSNSQIGTATALITGKGNYTGTARVTFQIKGSLGDADRARIVLNSPTYNGQEVALDESLILSATYQPSSGAAKNIVYGRDFILEKVENADYTNAGIAPVKVRATADGDYTGEKTINLVIQKKPLGASGVEVTIQKQTYRGFAYTKGDVKAEVTFTNDLLSKETLDPAEYEVSMVDGANYTDATGSTGAPVTVQALKDCRNFIGRTTARMVIEPLDITEALTVGTKNPTYKMIYDPVTITDDDLNLTLRSDFKTKYETLYGTVDSPVVAEDMLAALLTPEKGTSVIYRDAEEGEAVDRVDITEAELVYDTIGVSTIYVEGTGNYKGVVSGSIKMVGDLAGGALGDHPVTSLKYRGNEYFAGATDPEDQIAAYFIAHGRDVNPEPEVYYLGKLLTKDEDYKLEYKGTRNELTDKLTADTPKITITGLNDYLSGSFDVDYRVVPCDLSDTEYTQITIEGLEGLVYAAKPLTPNIRVYNDGSEIPDINIAFSNNVNGHQCSIDCAENNYRNCPTVTITPKEGNEYYVGTLVRNFDIRGIELNPDNYDIRVLDEDGYPFGDSYVFTGETIAPGVSVHVRPKDGVVGEECDLVLGQDFDVVYRDASDEDVNPFHAGAYNVCILGKNNYSGVVKQPYSITPKDIIRDSSIQIEVVNGGKYDGGNDVMPTLKIVDTQRRNAAAPSNISLYAMLTAPQEESYYELVERTQNEDSYDYAMAAAVSDDYNNKDAYVSSNKLGAVQVDAEGDYRGQFVTTYQIGQYELYDGDPNVSIQVADQTYTGGSLTPDVKVMLGTNALDPVDYTVEYGDNVNAGTGNVTILGAQRNLIGSYNGTFAIASRNLNTGITIDPIAPQPLRNGAATPEPMVRDGNIVLVKDVDYTLSYKNNTRIGSTATVEVTGTGNYVDTISAEFTVVADIAVAQTVPGEIGPQIYTGQPITPEIDSVQIKGSTLRRDVDYEISYLNNVEPGTATIVITGLGEYGGTKEINFEIYRDIDDTLTINALGAEYIFTGDPIEPLTGVLGAVTSGNNTLVENVDYTLSYENNVNVGTATVTVNGIGKYSGSVSREFNIIRRAMAQCQTSGIADITYNGSNAQPQVAVTYNNKTLTAGTDYTLVYLNNEKPGQARVLINGQGNFSGCKVVTFNIRMAGVSGASGQAASSTKISLSWSGAESVTGYEIYVGNQRIARISGTSYSISGLAPKTTYNYRIRAYTIKSGQVFYSDYTNVSVTTN